MSARAYDEQISASCQLNEDVAGSARLGDDPQPHVRPSDESCTHAPLRRR
jgi:hypothetical protein